MAEEANKTRDSLRRALLGKKQFKSVTINLFETEVELRQPSVRQILQFRESDDAADALADALINHAYVPGTDEKVFEAGDKDEILSWPVGPWFNQINDAIRELTDIDMEEAAKNSE